MKALTSDQSGAVAMEYGMIASLLAVAIITGLSPLGANLGTSFQTAANAILATQAPAAPPPAAAPPTAAPVMAAPKTPAP